MNIGRVFERYKPKLVGLLDWIKRLLTAPVFEGDEEKTRVSRLLNVVLLSMLGAFSLVTVLTPIVYGFPTDIKGAFYSIGYTGMTVMMVALIAIARRGHLQVASVILLLLIWAFIAAWIFGFAETSSDITNMVYLLIIVLASLLLGRRGATAFTILCALTVVAAFLEKTPTNWLEASQTLPFDLVVIVLVIAMTGLLQGHAVNSLARALKLVRRSKDALAERTRELEASQRVTFAASERVSPDDLLKMVVNLIRDQFDMYHVQVYLVDEERKAAVLRESTGYAGRQLLREKHQIPLDRPALVTKAIREGEPVLVADVSESSSFMPNPLLPKTKSELVVPLRVGGEIIGALDAQDRRPGRFTDSFIALFRVMVDQVAFLLENSELIERVSEQAKALTVFTNQLRTAADIAQRLSTIHDPDQLLQQVVELMHSRFGLYHVHAYLMDEKIRRLVVRAGSGEVGRVLREREHSIPIDEQKSLVSRAAREREVVLVNDTSQEPNFMPNPLLPQTRSEVAVPLIVGDEVLGVLDVQDDQLERFSQADLDTFQTLAGQVATALQNASYFEEIQKTAQRLREMDRLKSEFLANMSHELRTPLNSVIGYSEIILMGIDGGLDPETLEDVQAIYDNSQHLLRLINDVLDLAKIEAGHLALDVEEVQVEPLVDKVSKSAQGLLVNKPVEMNVQVEEGIPPIMGDRIRLNQILNNITSNAVKFTDEGSITLRAFVDGDGREGSDWVCFEIEDTGVGISREDQDRIFERFQQIDGSSARRADGTGLGLAITRHLVQMHGGTIGVRSKLGEGSTFVVRIPIGLQEVGGAADAASAN